MRPRPYPPTDPAEQAAVTVFKSLIDNRYVKADVRTRDKYPNIDGTIELVDEDGIPLGKLDVQIRAIGVEKTKYSCPVSLVAYSTRSTLAVLLICVDASNKRAFWRHISPAMPEFKDNQQSFTIDFSLVSDLIDPTGNYIQRWTQIALDYQDRISKFPILDKEVANKLKLQGVEASDRELFQRFIDTVNNLLDNDFIAVKEILYPGGWKLGVGIVSSDQSHVHYQLYTIPYREPSPLVCKLDSGFFPARQASPNAICEVISSRESIANHERAGKDFVLGEVRKIIEKRALPLYGPLLAADVLIAFVDSYYSCLGVAPDLDRYSVKDLEYALNQHLIQIWATLWSKIDIGSNVHIIMDLDSLSDFLRRYPMKPVASTRVPVNFSIQSRSFPVKAAFDALRYLVANQIKDVLRPFGRRDLPPSPGRDWILSGYSSNNEISSITHVLSHSIEEYKVFTENNRFNFPKSPYLDSNTSVIFEYEPIGSTEFDGPGFREHHIDNIHHALPKQLVFIRDAEHHHVDTSKFPNIAVDGTVYSASSSSNGFASFFFQPTPVLNLIYRMLSHDLSEHYKMTISAGMF